MSDEWIVRGVLYAGLLAFIVLYVRRSDRRVRAETDEYLRVLEADSVARQKSFDEMMARIDKRSRRNYRRLSRRPDAVGPGANVPRPATDRPPPAA